MIRVVALSVIAAFALTGCGASAFDRHVQAAWYGKATANEHADILRDYVRRDLEALREECLAESERAVCDAATLARAERFRPWVDAHNAVASAVDLYLAALLTAARDDERPMAAVIRAAARVVQLYDALVSVAAGLGVNLPRLPRAIVDAMGAT